MARYVAFLRGVNVGGWIIKMADVRACLTEVGLHKIATLLQSGNVLFESDAGPAELKQLIETALSQRFGYPARAQVLSSDALRQIVAAYPFGTAAADQHDYVVFIENELEKELLQEKYQLAPGEKVQAGRGVVYWRVDKGHTLKSSFAKVLTKAKYKDFNTNRNLKTLRKLLAT